MSFSTGTPESTRVQTGCMHGEFGLYPQTGACTSHSRSRLTLYLVPSIIAEYHMIPNELLDGNARIHSNLDRVHSRRFWSVSTREFTHELYMLHGATFALRRERQHRLISRHGAFTRDRSRSPVGQVLTKYDCTKLDQVFVCGVGRKNP